MGGLWAEVMGGVQAEAMGCCLNWGGVLAAVMGVQTGSPHSGEQLLCFWGGTGIHLCVCVTSEDTPARGGP